MSGNNGDRARDPVRLVEVTVRELGHIEADLTFDEKVYFLSRLDRARVPETMVWGLDADAEALVVAAREHGLDLKGSWFAKVYLPGELDPILERAAALGVPLSLGGRGSDFALEALGWTRAQMLDAAVT